MANRAPVRLALAFCSLYLVFGVTSFWSGSSWLFPLEEGCGETWFPARSLPDAVRKLWFENLPFCVAGQGAQEFPDESGEFTRHGGECFVAVEHASGEFAEAAVESVLGSPTDLLDPPGLGSLSSRR
jgi:hypothetical protein